MPWYIDVMPRKNQIAGHYGIYLKKGNKNGTITCGDAMNQAEKREYLIQRLLDEDRRYGGVDVPADVYEQKRILNQELANFIRRKPSGNLA